MAKRCYYEVLGVAKDVSEGDLKKSYRVLAMKYHPDRNAGDEEASVKFKEAAEAYSVLSDPEKRQLYDRYGHAGLEGATGPSFNSGADIFDMFGDIFGEIFGGGGGGRRRSRGPQPGSDLLYELEIDLLEAARGVKKTITIPRHELCNECNGSGARKGSQPATCRNCKGQGVTILSQGFFSVKQTCRSCGGHGQVITDPCKACNGKGRTRVKRSIELDIPPGAYHGLQLAVRGEGEAGSPGAPRGDLIIAIRLQEHQIFKREGDNLFCQVPITFSQAALGAEVEIATIDGPVNQKIKAGIQGGEAIRINGKGMPNLRTGRRGDLYVQVLVETPRQLSARQEELYRELAELDAKDVSPARKSFFEQIRDFFASSFAGEDAK